MAPSRQERRTAERSAAKRAPVQAGAAGAGAAPANLDVNPVGDWTTQTADPSALFNALGVAGVKRKAGEGDREAQWSLGSWLVAVEANNRGEGEPLGTAGRSPMDVGFEASNFAPHSFRPPFRDASMRSPADKNR